MLYQNYTVKDLNNLPAEYIINEMEFVKKIVKRQKEKLYWRYMENPDARGELYPILDDISRAEDFLSEARDVLVSRGEYEVPGIEQRRIERHRRLETVVRLEYETLSKDGLESLILDIGERYAFASSPITDGEFSSEVRKDILDAFLKSLSELRMEGWARSYRLPGEEYMTDVPSWKLILNLGDGKSVRFSGRGDGPYNFFKLQDSVRRLMNGIVSQ